MPVRLRETVANLPPAPAWHKCEALTLDRLNRPETLDVQLHRARPKDSVAAAVSSDNDGVGFSLG
jgi:hypothetical protein